MNDLAQIVDQLSKLSIMEGVDLSKMLEEKWGISASAMMGSAAPQAATPAAEKTEFNVVITAAGDNKIGVLKIVRDAANLELKKAKELVDNVPAIVKAGISKTEADELAKKITEAGATVKVE